MRTPRSEGRKQELLYQDVRIVRLPLTVRAIRAR